MTASRAPFWRRLLKFPLVLMIFGFAAVFLSLQMVALPLGFMGIQIGETQAWPPFLLVPAMMAGYAGYVRWIEHRSVKELAFSGASREFVLGYLFGALLFSAVIGALALIGVFAIVGTLPPIVMLAPFFWMIMHAVLEELIFRGLIFRLTERSLGSVIALLVSSAVFGAAHLLNPGATFFSAIAICLEAGILLGVTYMLTRRLWFCIGVHAAWNFVQGGVFSVPVSGGESVGLFEGRLHGSEWLTGGAFGAEASVVTVAICFCVATVLFLRARHLGHVLPPPWRRSQRVSGEPAADPV